MTPKVFAAFAFILFASFAVGGLAAAPTITSFTPTSAKLTTPVTITGTGFASPATVAFNGVVSSSATVNSATSIVAVVPSAGTTGPITVTVPGGTVTSSAVFTVIPGVVPSPSTVGSPGSATTLFFSSFGAYEAVDLYFDTTDLALGVDSGAGLGNVPVTIPTTATPGVHWISAVGRKSGIAAQTTFTIRTDATQYGFRPNHRGRNPFENVLSSSTVPNLEESWRSPAQGTTYATPSVVGGYVYAGFADGTVRAYSEATGAQKWAYTTGGPIVSSPAVVNGIVYIGSDDSYFYALDANTGALKWRYLAGNVIRSSPTVKGGIVYFGSFDDNIYALNATTGALVWEDAATGTVFSSPAVANGVVYIGCSDDNVYALKATTGELVWKATLGSAVYASPVLAGGRLFVGAADDKMYALRASNGSTVWTYTAGGAVESTAAVAGGVLYFGADDGKVYAVTAASGTLRWSTASPAGIALEQSVSCANGLVYAGDYEYTYILDAGYGGLYTTLPVGTLYGGPTVVNGAVLAGDYVDGVIVRYVVDASRGDATSARPDPARLRHHPLR